MIAAFGRLMGQRLHLTRAVFVKQHCWNTTARGEDAKALKPEAGYKARRWVGERTHSWMHRCRRVLIRWDKNVRNYLGFLHLACAYIRQSGLLE